METLRVVNMKGIQSMTSYLDVIVCHVIEMYKHMLFIYSQLFFLFESSRFYLNLQDFKALVLDVMVLSAVFSFTFTTVSFAFFAHRSRHSTLLSWKQKASPTTSLFRHIWHPKHSMW